MSEFKPEEGGSRPFLPDLDQINEPYTYADINKLRDELARLKETLSALKLVFEGDLSGYAIPVDDDDTKFVESHKAEWPDSLGDPRSQISYHYYKHLRKRSSTSARYLSKRYEEAARDVTGTPSLDLMILAELIESEALLVEEFLDGYVDKVDDSSEKRLLELFQDWVQSGLRYAREIGTHFTETPQVKLPSSEIERATREESRQGQAVFKVRLNKANESLDSNIQFLYKNFAEFAPVFYRQYLGPALDFRLNVSRSPLPINTSLSREVDAASSEIDIALRSAIMDQMRRRDLFSSKMNQITDSLKDRDRYRNYIIQLSEKGKSIPTSGPNVMVEADEDPVEIEHWYEEGIGDADDGTLIASHNSLLDRDDIDAHAQYLLKEGGTVTGDIHTAEGIRIDGIIPSTHAHTGEDGSAKIRGEDIIGGTLPPDVVDSNNKPPAPLDLRLVELREQTIPPGITVFDALIAWDGDNKYTYEVQIARV